MKMILVRCPAKVNLFLDIKNNDEVFQFEVLHDTVNIYDEFELAVSKKFTNKISSFGLSSDNSIDDNRNTRILKAINAFFDYTGINDYGVRVRLLKNIPSQIGLGSSSSDAAGVILGLNEYFDLHLSNKELVEIAYQVDSGVPYFLFGGYEQVMSNGRKIDKEKKSRSKEYIIALGNVQVNWENIKRSMNEVIRENMISDTTNFSSCFDKMLPQELIQIKKILLDAKADYASVNGFSSTVVGGFSDYHARYNALIELKKQKVKTILCKPVEGISLYKKFI